MRRQGERYRDARLRCGREDGSIPRVAHSACLTRTCRAPLLARSAIGRCGAICEAGNITASLASRARIEPRGHGRRDSVAGRSCEARPSSSESGRRRGDTRCAHADTASRQPRREVSRLPPRLARASLLRGCACAIGARAERTGNQGKCSWSSNVMDAMGRQNHAALGIGTRPILCSTADHRLSPGHRLLSAKTRNSCERRLVQSGPGE